MTIDATLGLFLKLEGDSGGFKVSLLSFLLAA